jgi:hypothetical protein
MENLNSIFKGWFGEKATQLGIWVKLNATKNLYIAPKVPGEQHCGHPSNLGK